jgi:hypothetical protein
VLRAAQQCSLAFNSTSRLRISIRQPGEYCNLRMSHSVGGKNLFALGVVADTDVGKTR